MMKKSMSCNVNIVNGSQGAVDEYLRFRWFPRSHALRGNAYLGDEHFISSGFGEVIYV